MFYDNLKVACNKLNLKITPIVLECGGAKGSISNWKNGASPNSDIVAKLSVRLNVSTDFLILGEEKGAALSSDERELLSYYERLPEKEQIKLISRAELLAEQYEEQQRECELGRKRNIVYIQLDKASEKVSAGTGIYLSDSQTEQIEVEKNDLTYKADFVLTISGDSMEPVYHNNDMILVKYQPFVKQGEIGIFIVNGEGFVKRFGGDRLISLNPDYDDILLSQNDSIYCQGKVLGILDPKLTREYQEQVLNKT